MKQIEDSGYSIDEYGNIYNRKDKKMKSQINGKGYVTIKLFIKKKRFWFYIHRLVCKLFVDNPDNKPQVNHIDGDKLNNHYLNLEWVTNQENRDHAVENELHAFGEKANNKLTQEQVEEIKLSNDCMKTLSLKYNVHRGTIWKIKKGKRWKHL